MQMVYVLNGSHCVGEILWWVMVQSFKNLNIAEGSSSDRCFFHIIRILFYLLGKLMSCSRRKNHIINLPYQLSKITIKSDR